MKKERKGVLPRGVVSSVLWEGCCQADRADCPVSLCLSGLHVLEETGQVRPKVLFARRGGHDAAILGSGVRMPGF